jgi:hypothetical protein
MQVCARSYGSLVKGWWFCNEPRGHAGPCACAGVPKREDEMYFEAQPEAQAFIDKQRADEAKERAKKGLA